MTPERLEEIRQFVSEGGTWATPEVLKPFQECIDFVDRLQLDLAQRERWIEDLMSEMFVNCVYCGHRYGRVDKVPATQAEVLKQHIAQCPKHPMAALLQATKRAVELIREWHGMHMSPDSEVVAWDLYLKNAPEIQPILEAIATAEGRG